jgi:zinc/manganese transport system permease protein
VRGGRASLATLGIAACAAVALAGLLLALFPGMDHHWLDWLESGVPAVELAFLSPAERQAWRDSREGLARGSSELRRLRTLQEDVQWGRATLSPEQQERLRQFLAARGEITEGDRFVLATLRGRARERQRYWLGVPLLLAGATGGLAFAVRERGATVTS